MTRKTIGDGLKQLHQDIVGDDRPTPPTPATAAASATATPTHGRPTPVPTSPPPAPAPPAEEKTKSMHIRLPESIHRPLRRMAAETDRTHRDIVIDAITRYVAKYKDPTR